jgi:DNA-binding transcriptional LysR family regulator
MTRLVDPVTLRLFVSICEMHSIARAAEREALVASAVSKRIVAIEDRMGVQLLVRGRRGVEPTAAGQALLRQAREVLGALDRLNAELDGFAGGVQGSVRVAASVSALAEDLPDDVAAFLETHPGLRVSLDERPSAEVVRDVHAGSAELGVAWDAVDAQGLHATPYRHDHLRVIVPAAHPLAGRARVRFAETLDHPSVALASTGLVGLVMQREAARAGRTLVHRMQVSSLDACIRIVAAGMGLAILPAESAAVQANARRLVMLELDESWAERRFVVLSRAEAALPLAARRLLEHLGRCAQDGGTAHDAARLSPVGPAPPPSPPPDAHPTAPAPAPSARRA